MRNSSVDHVFLTSGGEALETLPINPNFIGGGLSNGSLISYQHSNSLTRDLGKQTIHQRLSFHSDYSQR